MLQWRRDKVIELRGLGLTYAEIARELQVSTSSIGTDVQYLREQAKENINEFVTMIPLSVVVLKLSHLLED